MCNCSISLYLSIKICADLHIQFFICHIIGSACIEVESQFLLLGFLSNGKVLKQTMLPRTHVQDLVSELTWPLSLSDGTWDTKPPRTLVSTTNSSLFFMGRLVSPNYIFVYLQCYLQYCFITIYWYLCCYCIFSL